ncbi:hypothetical protein WT19_04110 [Burkholderia stagnalis]|uniref:Uncharacterized protein n=1 Tax=Burkholderia stagnalis TaxID=1503054 RepID=A0A6L3MW24_9BURK|nr:MULTISPECIES: hypothetical protein [Burkholderia]KAB0636917.1 hypothetical protein F7R25_17755 [Burkholderia stagnalis]KVO47473.1 hypothetical protein WT17_06565 [Burkholderia stagnalis]KVO79844.1 hypothetical protein WT19_04110 [Burkholderia stagnalis]KVW55956.1 hypothetical protein WT28_27840 [Burkholderia stagnalis]MDV2108625.1 hypothetical protein [Burkholderia pseudomallei]
MFMSLWFAASAATALGIASDMQCLGVNCVGTSLKGWLLACACAGPIAAGVYIYRRRAVWRSLITAVWQAVGDESHPMHERRQRLLALRQTGVISRRVFLACWEQLKDEERFPGVRNR